MKGNIISSVTLLSCIVLMMACGEEEAFDPKSSFIKIYNDESFSSAYIPMDIVEAGGKGFFILSAYEGWNTYILRIDENGEFLWDSQLPENYVNPINGLYYRDNAFYFFCMDDLSLGTYLMKVTDQTRSAAVERTYGDIVYPLASSAIADGYILESYNRESYSTRLTKFNANFSRVWEEEYEVEQDVEPFIIRHLTRIGERLPFYTGQAGNQYYLNGYFNYSMSLIFVNASDGTQTGVVNGFRNESAISSTQHIEGSTFALSRFDHGENYIIPRINLNTSGIGISSDLSGNEHPEMTPNAFVHCQSVDILGKKVIMYGTSTKSGQMLLYAYDQASGTLIGTQNIGNINPYESVKFVATEDGGLALLGNTFVNGRFSRIALVKLSEAQLMEFAY